MLDEGIFELPEEFRPGLRLQELHLFGQIVVAFPVSRHGRTLGRPGDGSRAHAHATANVQACRPRLTKRASPPSSRATYTGNSPVLVRYPATTARRAISRASTGASASAQITAAKSTNAHGRPFARPWTGARDLAERIFASSPKADGSPAGIERRPSRPAARWNFSQRRRHPLQAPPTRAARAAGGAGFRSMPHARARLSFQSSQFQPRLLPVPLPHRAHGYEAQRGSERRIRRRQLHQVRIACEYPRGPDLERQSYVRRILWIAMRDRSQPASML